MKANFNSFLVVCGYWSIPEYVAESFNDALNYIREKYENDPEKAFDDKAGIKCKNSRNGHFFYFDEYEIYSILMDVYEPILDTF